MIQSTLRRLAFLCSIKYYWPQSARLDRTQIRPSYSRPPLLTRPYVKIFMHSRAASLPRYVVTRTHGDDICLGSQEQRESRSRFELSIYYSYYTTYIYIYIYIYILFRSSCKLRKLINIVVANLMLYMHI